MSDSEKLNHIRNHRFITKRLIFMKHKNFNRLTEVHSINSRQTSFSRMPCKNGLRTVVFTVTAQGFDSGTQDHWKLKSKWPWHSY